MATPKHWPTGVTYITKPVYHSSVTKDVVNLLRSSVTGGGDLPLVLSELQTIPVAPAVESSHRLTHIQRIDDKEHPAQGQLGLFASRKVAADTMLLFYIGEVHAQDRDSDYDLSLLRIPLQRPTGPGKSDLLYSLPASVDTQIQSPEAWVINLGVDAARIGNEARCINDYRGIAQRPNAVFKLVRERNTREVRMSVWTSRALAKNEEILVSYGKGWWNARHIRDLQ